MLLDKPVVKEGESRKFNPRYAGIYRIIRKYDNNTVDITDNTYQVKRVNINPLKLVYETQLYRDEAFENFDPTEEIVRDFHNHVSTQTIDIFTYIQPDKLTELKKKIIKFQQLSIHKAQRVSRYRFLSLVLF